jgi:hypothetical protein
LVIFITMQPKTGTPAGCRGALTPIHFAFALRRQILQQREGIQKG